MFAALADVMGSAFLAVVSVHQSALWAFLSCVVCLKEILKTGVVVGKRFIEVENGELGRWHAVENGTPALTICQGIVAIF